jgi:hypothetical protein
VLLAPIPAHIWQPLGSVSLYCLWHLAAPWTMFVTVSLPIKLFVVEQVLLIGEHAPHEGGRAELLIVAKRGWQPR